jgi:hypothetical protein
MRKYDAGIVSHYANDDEGNATPASREAGLRWHDNDTENMTPEWRRRGGGERDEGVEKMRRWKSRGGGEDKEVEGTATGWRTQQGREYPGASKPPEGIVTRTRRTYRRRGSAPHIFFFCFHLITNNPRRDYPSLGTIYLFIN